MESDFHNVACSAPQPDIVRNVVRRPLRLIEQRLNSSLDVAANCPDSRGHEPMSAQFFRINVGNREREKT